jgi:hypothetical protein
MFEMGFDPQVFHSILYRLAVAIFPDCSRKTGPCAKGCESPDCVHTRTAKFLGRMLFGKVLDHLLLPLVVDQVHDPFGQRELSYVTVLCCHKDINKSVADRNDV